jgi:hypothetical protein
LKDLRNIPLQQRMRIEDVSSRLGIISKTMIHRYLKKGMFRHHFSSVNPYLTEANKKSRLKWCIDMIDQSLLDDPKFNCLTLCLLMRSGSIYIINQRGTTCYLIKMNHIAFARTRTTFLDHVFLCRCSAKI